MSLTVVHTIASFDLSTGGPAQSVPQLCSALLAAGVDVRIWVAEGIQKGSESRLGQLMDVIIPNLSELSSMNAKDTVIHDHGLWRRNNWRVAQLASSHSLKRVVSPRGMLEPWAMNYKKWKKKLAWALYQHGQLQSATVLHATAPAETARFRELGLKAPILEQPNGVSLPACPAREARSDETRVALFLGRVHPKKGLLMLVDAWAKVRPPGWKMLVVGPDELGHREQVQSRVAEAGLSDDWEFRPQVDGDAKADLYSQSDLLILPTYSENFGISVAEALASGLPVITTQGAPWEGLLEHGCGWWVEPTPDALAQALSLAINLAPADLKAMGQKGQVWVRRDFDWNQIASQMALAYEWLAGGGSPPDCIKT